MSSKLGLKSLRHDSLGMSMYWYVTFQFSSYHFDMSHLSISKATMCIFCSRALQEHPVQSSVSVFFPKHTFFTFSTYPSSMSVHAVCSVSGREGGEPW